MIGRQLGHYAVIESLGTGGMGEVYRATDQRLGRDVALKVLPPHLQADAERLERFRREARALASIDHASIVTVYSVEEADGVPFLTMQLVEGRSLADVIRDGELPIDRVGLAISPVPSICSCSPRWRPAPRPRGRRVGAPAGSAAVKRCGWNRRGPPACRRSSSVHPRGTDIASACRRHSTLAAPTGCRSSGSIQNRRSSATIP